MRGGEGGCLGAGVGKARKVKNVARRKQAWKMTVVCLGQSRMLIRSRCTRVVCTTTSRRVRVRSTVVPGTKFDRIELLAIFKTLNPKP